MHMLQIITYRLLDMGPTHRVPFIIIAFIPSNIGVTPEILFNIFGGTAESPFDGRNKPS
jgi:hypothetical protein